MWWRELEERGRAGAVSLGPGRIDPSAIVAEGAVLDGSQGPITIGANSRICEGARIVGPVDIGADCLIGNLALVRGYTSLGNGTRVGFATEIKNAIVEERVSIGPQCFVADSKIEADAYLGAQVRTSNHRLDRQPIRVLLEEGLVDTGRDKLGCLIGARASLGIQVIVLPGRIVAPDSVFAPRITIERNWPTGRYRQAQQLETF